MIRTLLKKQLTEIFRSYFYNPKKNTARSRIGIAAMFVLFCVLMVGVMGGMFAFLSFSMCEPFAAVGMNWMYFLILGLISILLGAFGSVFSTYSGLYLSKDNDMLLSMPVPIRAILISRLLGVYLMGLMYSAIVCIPALIVYWITVGPTLANVVCGLLWFLGISLFVLVLSCVLGWAVARISVKLKNRSFITVLLALLFLALYYFVYFKAAGMFNDLINNAAIYGAKIKGSAWILFAFGMSGTGSWTYTVGFFLVMLALFGVTCYVLSRSFLKIATASRTVAKVRYKERNAKQSSLPAALLRKELSHFTHSPTYMLNCGLGILLLPAMGILILVLGKDAKDLIGAVFGESGLKFIPVVSCMAMGSIASMIDTTPPSVSLEGKSLWILQSLPVDPWQALKAKLKMHLLLSLIPTVFCAACMAFILADSFLQGVMMVLYAVACVLLFAFFGLFIGTKMPNLTWINETVPVKQSGAVAIALLGGMAWCFLYGGLYFLITLYFDVPISPSLYLLFGIVLNLLISLACLLWLRKRGAERFSEL